MNLHSAMRSMIPRPIRIEQLRSKRYFSWLLESNSIAFTRLTETEQRPFGFLLTSHNSPLSRSPGQVSPLLQSGKERNIRIASQQIDGLLIRPYETFSYHRTVGRPSRLRGYRNGMELHEGKISQGIGGGCCQISNMLYLLALRSGMKIIERHRHGVDIFPDHGRTVPFGCGATVFYNYVDLRFENPLPTPVLLKFRILEGILIGEIWSKDDPGWTAEIYESEHNRYRDGNEWIRENRVRRRFLRADGQVTLDQEVAHNRARILYEISDEDEQQYQRENSL